MRYNSAFEIIGPIMVGPSSSHTAGAVRIGNLARTILKEEPRHVVFYLMGSFAETYQGHGTDVALLAGVLGYETDDPRISQADELATAAGVDFSFEKRNFGFFHPNSVSIHIQGATRGLTMIASSLGGGKVEVQEINEIPVKFTGERPTLMLYHTDTQGFLAKVFYIINSLGYNIARLSLERWSQGGNAITVCEIDGKVGSHLTEQLMGNVEELQDLCFIQPE